tara:strand:- start:3142 stop:3261 length:120 start_codon:yes stop_codon:yes gene_type:complete
MKITEKFMSITEIKWATLKLLEIAMHLALITVVAAMIIF